MLTVSLLMNAIIIVWRRNSETERFGAVVLVVVATLTPHSFKLPSKDLYCRLACVWGLPTIGLNFRSQWPAG